MMVAEMASNGSAEFTICRYGIYVEIDFGDQGIAFLTLTDRGRWSLDTAEMNIGELRHRLEQFQAQTEAEIRLNLPQTQHQSVP